MMDDSGIADLTAKLRAVVSRLRRRLREQGTVGDLTHSQVATLQRLERDGPATASALARAEGLRPQSMGTIVAALEAAGLVASAADPNDGRKTLISLTPLLIERLAAGRAAHQDWLSDQIRRLTPEEQAQLAAATEILERISGS